MNVEQINAHEQATGHRDTSYESVVGKELGWHCHECGFGDEDRKCPQTAPPKGLAGNTAEKSTVRSILAAHDPDLVLFDDLDDAVIGVGYRHASGDSFVVYDRAKCIDVFVAQGMTYEEAVEWFEFNVEGAYVGTRTPAFVTRLEDIKD